jgi:hypothetical protein
MTLLIGIATADSIWMCGDRRLTASNGQRDDARKVVGLDCQDGVALVGYAGLGATRLDAPDLSAWVVNTLNCRNEPVVQSLAILAEAAQRRIWPRLDSTIGEHRFAIVAFVDGKPRICTIGLSADGRFEFVERPFRGDAFFIYAGSGAKKARNREPEMRRALSHFVGGSSTADDFARFLASVNFAVCTEDKDPFVGPTCTVGWRSLGNASGDSKGFDGTTEVSMGDMRMAVPIIARGINVEALSSVALPEMKRHLDALRSGTPYETADEAHNAELAKLAAKPDDRLP